jgi:hypothetical protein
MAPGVGSRERMDRAVETGKTGRPFPPEGSKGAVPYRAGEPARNWHLAGSTPVGCRGFNGPVPPPLWISRLQLCMHGAKGGADEQAGDPRRVNAEIGLDRGGGFVPGRLLIGPPRISYRPAPDFLRAGDCRLRVDAPARPVPPPTLTRHREARPGRRASPERKRFRPAPKRVGGSRLGARNRGRARHAVRPSTSPRLR